VTYGVGSARVEPLVVRPDVVLHGVPVFSAKRDGYVETS
jgi:hypothetical protein